MHVKNEYIPTCDRPRPSPCSISAALRLEILEDTAGMETAGSMSWPPKVGANELKSKR